MTLQPRDAEVVGIGLLNCRLYVDTMQQFPPRKSVNTCVRVSTIEIDHLSLRNSIVYGCSTLEMVTLFLPEILNCHTHTHDNEETRTGDE